MSVSKTDRLWGARWIDVPEQAAVRLHHHPHWHRNPHPYRCPFWRWCNNDEKQAAAQGGVVLVRGSQQCTVLCRVSARSKLCLMQGGARLITCQMRLFTSGSVRRREFGNVEGSLIFPKIYYGRIQRLEFVPRDVCLVIDYAGVSWTTDYDKPFVVGPRHGKLYRMQYIGPHWKLL
jgi:hypothetical protein